MNRRDFRAFMGFFYLVPELSMQQTFRLDMRIDKKTLERLDRLAKELQANRSKLIRVLIENAQPQELEKHLAQLEGAGASNPQKVR